MPITLEPLPDRTLIVLRNEAKAAREGSMIIQGPDIDMAELLEDAASEIEQLRRALEAVMEACELDDIDAAHELARQARYEPER